MLKLSLLFFVHDRSRAILSDIHVRTTNANRLDNKAQSSRQPALIIRTTNTNHKDNLKLCSVTTPLPNPAGSPPPRGSGERGREGPGEGLLFLGFFWEFPK